jgi:hypothetical protein
MNNKTVVFSVTDLQGKRMNNNSVSNNKIHAYNVEIVN